MVREQVDTMPKMLDFVSSKYKNKRCLGTRRIIAEEDEIQPNGRVFKKVQYRNCLCHNHINGLTKIKKHIY